MDRDKIIEQGVKAMGRKQRKKRHRKKQQEQSRLQNAENAPLDETDDAERSQQAEPDDTLNKIRIQGKRWRNGNKASVRQTQLGLSCVFFGIIIMLGSILTVIALPYFMEVRSLLALLGFAGIGMMLGSVLVFVGPILCLSVPAESGAKGLIIASVCFQIGHVVYTFASFFAPARIPVDMNYVLNFCGAIGGALFVLFMKRLARFIGETKIETRAVNVLFVASAAVVLVGFVLMGDKSSTDIFNFYGLLFAAGVAATLAFVMFIGLVNSLRKALGP